MGVITSFAPAQALRAPVQHKSLINPKHAVFTALEGWGTGEEINTHLLSLLTLEITPIIVS